MFQGTRSTSNREMGTMLYSMVETRICRENINTNRKFDRDEIYRAFVLFVDNLIRYHLGLNKYRECFENNNRTLKFYLF